MPNIFRSRFNFESAAASILYEPHKVGCERGLRHKLHPVSGYLQLGDTMPLLEKDRAIPLEFKHAPIHLPRKHSPIVARFRRTGRRADGAIDLFAS